MLIKRKLPENLKESDRKYFEKEFEKHIENPSSFLVANAFANHQGVVFSKAKFVRESLVSNTSNPFTFFTLAKQIIKNRRIRLRKGEIIAIVSDYWYSGYFHWITDTLPRLLFLLKSRPDCIPMIPSDKKLSFIEKSLLPFRFRKVVFLEKDEYIFTKRLLLINHTASTGNYNEEMIREIRKLFRFHFEPTNSQNFDKIYVSRSKSGRRRVINELAVSTLLNEYGFVTLHFEDFSFEEQIKMASQAKVLIGLHGAGLTNMIFMAEQASVLEFRPENDDSNLCYYALASALHLKYYYQFGQSPIKVDYNDDVEIDLVLLRENVELMVKKNDFRN